MCKKILYNNAIIAALPMGFVALSVFFFLAPGYEKLAVVCSFAGLVLRFCDVRAFKALMRAPYVFVGAIGIYAFASVFVEVNALKQHLLEFAFGITVATTSYYAYAQPDMPIRYMFAAIALPLLMHLLFFIPIIPIHIIHANVPIIIRFESLRISAQIGIKLLSHALSLLIPILYYLLCIVENKYERLLVRTIFPLACVCLALLDSRAAYISIFVGIMMGFYVKQVMLKQSEHSESYDRLIYRAKQIRRFVLVLVALCIAVAVAVGWHRLNRIDATLHAAVDRDYYTSWITPQTWVQEFCPSNAGECRVDNSAYLRLSWILFGGQAIVNHPWRISPASAPLERALAQEYPILAENSPIYTDSHSGLIDAGLNYGVLGVVGFLCMLLIPLYRLLAIARLGKAPDYVPLLVVLWGIIVTRSIIDGVGTNLWYVAWAFGGIAAALMTDRRQGPRHAV